jgi:thiol-disulfide isomerase/thioredoxin
MGDDMKKLWSLISAATSSPLDKKDLALAPYTPPWVVLITLEECPACDRLRPTWHRWVDEASKIDSQRRFFSIQVQKDQRNLPAEVHQYVAFYPTILAVNDASARSYWEEENGTEQEKKEGKNLAPLIAVRYPYGDPLALEFLEIWYQKTIVSPVELNSPLVLKNPPPPLLLAIEEKKEESENGATNLLPAGKGKSQSNPPEHRKGLDSRVLPNTTSGQHLGRYRTPSRKVRRAVPT